MPTPGLNLTRHQLDTVHIHPDSISRTLTKAALPAKMRIAGSGLSRESPSVWRQRLRNLLRFAGVGKHFIADDAQCYFTKIGLQDAIKLDELGPKNLIDEAPRRPDHDRVAPLPMKAIGAQPVTTA